MNALFFVPYFLYIKAVALIPLLSYAKYIRNLENIHIWMFEGEMFRCLEMIGIEF